jgi:hypothetical protein
MIQVRMSSALTKINCFRDETIGTSQGNMRRLTARHSLESRVQGKLRFLTNGVTNLGFAEKELTLELVD